MLTEISPLKPNKAMQLVDAHTHQDIPNASAISIQNISIGRDTLTPNQVEVCSVGIHPWYLRDVEAQLEQLRQWAILPTVWAIGECGLDRLIDTPISRQQAIFEQQIRLAEAVQKPMIIHCVRAMAEVAALRKKHQPKQPWILHGFNNRLTLLEPLIRADFHISLGAALLQTDSPAQTALLHIPLNQLFLETDDSSIQIQDIYQAAATILNQSMDELIKTIWENATSVFRT